MTEQKGFYPGRPAIEAYGNGGFRFAGMSHKGSLLLLPSGVHAWPLATAEGIALAAFDAVFANAEGLGFLLLGTGRQQVFPSLDVRRGFAERGFGLDVMDTGAACRTYNVLLAEGRPVGAALIAVS